MNIGESIEHARNGGAFRLPQWQPDVSIKMQVPDEHSKMTAPYLYVESRFGRVPWVPTMIELLHQGFEKA